MMTLNSRILFPIALLILLVSVAHAQPTNVLIILPDDLSYDDFSFIIIVPMRLALRPLTGWPERACV